MIAFYRTASIAVVTLCTALGGASAPSFAETVTTAVSSIANEEVLPSVPQVEPTQAIQDVESAPAAAAVQDPVELPRASSLAQLVAQQSMPSAMDRETECLAASIYFEAKGEPLEGQLAVAEVVKNRAKSGRFPSTICSVVLQKGQFHFVRGGGFPPIAKASRAWREAVAIAQIELSDSWDSRASKALFFHATRVAPGWNKTRVATLGNHVFYR